MQLLLKVPGRKAPPPSTLQSGSSLLLHMAQQWKESSLVTSVNPKHINGESKMLEDGGHSMPEKPEKYIHKRVEQR